MAGGPSAAGGGRHAETDLPLSQTRNPYWRSQAPRKWTAKRSLAFLGSGGLLLFFLSPLVGENGLPAYFKLRPTRDQLRNEVESYQQLERELDQQISELENDDQILERIAREEYGMHRRDEEVIEIVKKRTVPESP